jgi:hypothetical protein
MGPLSGGPAQEASGEGRIWDLEEESPPRRSFIGVKNEFLGREKLEVASCYYSFRCIPSVRVVLK